MPSQRRVPNLGLTRWLAVIAVLSIACVLVPRPAAAGAPTGGTAIATVRYIFHGVLVQAPHKKAAPGKLKQNLYASYKVKTLKTQRASLGYADGTLLHLNQVTAATLASVGLTHLNKGEIQEVVMPGTSHQVQTSAATLSAIGTHFDVRVKGKVTTVIVLEGSVQVSNARGTVTVQSRQKTTVSAGKAPAPPSSAANPSSTGWSSGIPGPTQNLVNVALGANGGRVLGASSVRPDPNGQFAAANVSDGRLDRGFETAPGDVSDGWVVVRLGGSNLYHIVSVILDCAATGGRPAGDDLKDFEIDTSRDGILWSTLITGTCRQQTGPQPFQPPSQLPQSPAPIDQANYIRIALKNNYGGNGGIALAEMQIVSDTQPQHLGTPTPATAGSVGISSVAMYEADTPPATHGTGCSAPGEKQVSSITSSDGIMFVRITFSRFQGTHTVGIDVRKPLGFAVLQNLPGIKATDLAAGAQMCVFTHLDGRKDFIGGPATLSLTVQVDGDATSVTGVKLTRGPDRIVYEPGSGTVYRESAPLPANICAFPKEQQSSTIQKTDTYVVVKAHFSVWQGSHTLHEEFHAPNGSNYVQGTFSEERYGQTGECWAVGVAGLPAAAMPGAWNLLLFLDNTLAATIPFTIQ